jgi:hypothetical protein
MTGRLEGSMRKYAGWRNVTVEGDVEDAHPSWNIVVFCSYFLY